MARLLEKYRNEVLPRLMEEAGTKNRMAVPRLRKIVISMGVGRAAIEKRLVRNPKGPFPGPFSLKE